MDADQISYAVDDSTFSKVNVILVVDTCSPYVRTHVDHSCTCIMLSIYVMGGRYSIRFYNN